MTSDSDSTLALVVQGLTPDDDVGSLLFRMFCAAGADPDSTMSALHAWGFRLKETSARKTSPVEDTTPRERRGQSAFDRVLQKAVVYGIRLAREGDDYGRNEGLDGYGTEGDIQGTILTPADREGQELLLTLLTIADDLHQSKLTAREEIALAKIREVLHVQLDRIQERRLTVDLIEDDWNCPDERRRYYFMLGVVKYLHRQGIIDSSMLGSGLTRRVRGYNVARAYISVAREVPILGTLAAMDVPKLLRMTAREVQGLIGGLLPEGER